MKKDRIKILIYALLVLAVFAVISRLFFKEDGPQTLEERVPDIEDVEIDSFQIKDSRVYYRQVGNMREIAEVDLDTFEVIDNYYAKDKFNVYFKNFPIKEARPDSFQAIDELWSKDQESAFCSQVSVYKSVIKEADAATFEKVGGDFYKDKDNVFERCHISEIPDLDPETFEIVDENTVKDKNGEYNIE